MSCLFFWQLKYLLTYISTHIFILKNQQCCRKNWSVLFTLKWLCNDSSWCFFIVSSILFANIWNFFFFIEYCFLSSLIIRNIAHIFCLFVDNDSSWLILKILWSKIYFVFIWSLRLLNAFALSFSLSSVYCIVNLYCSKNFDHYICRLFNCFVVIKCKRFLWFVKIVNFDAFSTYIFHVFKNIIIASNFLSWIS